MKMETLSEYLFNKLILVDRVTKVTDMEKAIDHLKGALEVYYEKWMTGKNKNAEILRKADALLMAEKKKEVSILQPQEPTMGAG